MIDELRPMAIFAETIKQGSFRAAADSLDLSPSVVSYQVSQLEKKLGTALIYRSTRNLSLTHEGSILYRHTIDMLESANQAFEQLAVSSNVLKGKLTVTLPTALIRSPMVNRIAEFNRLHPEVIITLKFNDDRQNIIAGGFDFAIRAGELENSDYRFRKIGKIERLLVCSPKLIKSSKPPRNLTELEDWNWVRLEMLPCFREFKHRNGKAKHLHFSSNFVVDSVEAMTQMCIEGVGVATPPKHLIEDELANEKLVHLFPDWKVKSIPLYAVWPNNVSLQSNVKALINYIVEA